MYAERVAELSVAPESGIGELRGLRGEAPVAVAPDGGHSFALEYDLG